MNTVKSIRTLLPLLRLYPWAMPTIVVLGILSSLSEGLGISLFIPLLQSLESIRSQAAHDNWLASFLDQFFVNIAGNNRLIVIALIIFGALLLKNCLTYSLTILFAWLNSRIGDWLRSRIFSQLLRVNILFIEGHESGKLMNTLASETWRTSQALSVLVTLITSLCTITVFIALLILISWQLTLTVTIALVLISGVIQYVTRHVKSLGQQAVRANEVLASRMWEGFGGMRVIRTFGREAYEQGRFDGASGKVRDIFLKLDTLSALVNPFSEVLAAALLLSILVGALLLDRTALPTLITFLFILHRLHPKVKQFNGARVNLAGLSSAVEDVMALLDCSDKPYIYSGWVPFEGLRQGIIFESVTFRYNWHDRPALREISIAIPQGKTTALVGPSGAGKSTLINLVCRFHDPTAGEICVDNSPLGQLQLDSWRSRIAIVSQDVYMFSTTIRENIAYGHLEATEQEIIAAAKLANAHEFISGFPKGYDTPVGDRGIRLSGGQRQRIALARAIVRDPEIFILDEATNSLDSISENLIQEALSTLSQNRTVIVIAHRLSTIEQADQIIVLEEGRVVEQGNLQQLLQRDGLFARLYRLQYRNAHAEVS